MQISREQVTRIDAANERQAAFARQGDRQHLKPNIAGKDGETGGRVSAASRAVRFEREHRSEEPRRRGVGVRAVARAERRGPHQPAVGHDLEVAAGPRGQLVPVRVDHLHEEAAAWPQVDLALDGAIRPGAEPGHQVLRRRPGLEDQFGRHVDHALQHQVAVIRRRHPRSPSS